MKLITLILICLAFYSCEDTRKGTVQNGEVKKAVSEYHVPLNDSDQYESMGNPDTALAMWLWKNYSDTNVDAEFEIYQRWDLEYDKISKILAQMFGANESFANRMHKIDSNRMVYVRYARNEVIQAYEKYGVVNADIEFYFLCERKDSIITPFMEMIRTSERMSAEEKKRLETIVERNWGFTDR